MTTTAPAPTRAVTRAASAVRREITLFRLAILAIALHVIDDSFIQPQPGTSAGDHLVSGMLPLSLLGLAAWAYPRVRAGWRGATALFFGPLGIAAGIEAYYYSREPVCCCSRSAPSRCGARGGRAGACAARCSPLPACLPPRWS